MYNYSGSSTVYMAVDKLSGIEVAIKQIDVTEQPVKELTVGELRVLQDIKHPNIVEYLDSYLLHDTLWVFTLNTLFISTSKICNFHILCAFSFLRL